MADMQRYCRDFVLAVLRDADEAMDAASVAEQIQIVALADGHPPAAWRKCDPLTVSAHLRAMCEAGLVVKTGQTRCPRNRRRVPLYVLADKSQPHRIPNPPRDEQAAARLALSDRLNDSQLLTMLEVSDEVMGLVGRFMRDLQELQAQARQRLARAGVKVQP